MYDYILPYIALCYTAGVLFLVATILSEEKDLIKRATYAFPFSPITFPLAFTAVFIVAVIGVGLFLFDGISSAFSVDSPEHLE